MVQNNKCETNILGKINIGNIEHDITLRFNNEYMKWINSVISLIDIITTVQLQYTQLSQKYNTDFINKPEYSFLGTSITSLNQLLYLFVKDELAESTSNFSLPYLCQVLSTEENIFDIERKFLYLNQVLRYDFDSLMGPFFFDTYVGIWSCFEDAINAMTINDEPKIKLLKENSEFKKYSNFLKNNLLVELSELLPPNKIDNILKDKREVILKKTSVYISIHDRINYVFKRIEKLYNRNIKKDRHILLFLGALRNTIHNNGKHIGSDMEVELSGKTLFLKKNEAVYFDDYRECFTALVTEIIDIYCEIIRCITIQEYSNS